ncbi:hypothetical protein NKH77_15505 [Streptomyces sp. M19]
MLRVAAVLVAFACTVGFAVALAHLTLEPSAASERLAHTNLRPGASIRAYVTRPGFVDSVKQVGGNLLLGCRSGCCCPCSYPACGASCGSRSSPRW